MKILSSSGLPCLILRKNTFYGSSVSSLISASAKDPCRTAMTILVFPVIPPIIPSGTVLIGTSERAHISHVFFRVFGPAEPSMISTPQRPDRIMIRHASVPKTAWRDLTANPISPLIFSLFTLLHSFRHSAFPFPLSVRR